MIHPGPAIQAARGRRRARTANCPATGFPPNYLAQLNPWTGVLTRMDVAGPSFGPQGLVFITPGWNAWPRIELVGIGAICGGFGVS